MPEINKQPQMIDRIPDGEDDYRSACKYIEPCGIFRFDVSAEQQAEAINYLKRACDKRHPKAMCLLGYIYQNGDGTDVNIAQAFSLYCSAMELGSVDSLYFIGCFYEEGNAFVEVNLSYALEFFTEAHEKGCFRATKKLCCIYLDDFIKQVELLEYACSKGNIEAITLLADIYMKGKGSIQKDTIKSLVYYEKAASMGDPVARTTLHRFYTNPEMSCGQARDIAYFMGKEAKQGDVAYEFLGYLKKVISGSNEDNLPYSRIHPLVKQCSVMSPLNAVFLPETAKCTARLAIECMNQVKLSPAEISCHILSFLQVSNGVEHSGAEGCVVQSGAHSYMPLAKLT